MVCVVVEEGVQRIEETTCRKLCYLVCDRKNEADFAKHRKKLMARVTGTKGETFRYLRSNQIRQTAIIGFNLVFRGASIPLAFTSGDIGTFCCS